MKKQNIINLVKYYVEKNDSAFRNEVVQISLELEKNGDAELSNFLMDLISTTNYYVPQNNYQDLVFLKKTSINNESLILPEEIKDDILGIIRAANSKISISKVLFYGLPGSGKTKSAYQIARLLDRDLLIVNMEELIDSHMGQTSKNVVALFNEINHLASQKVVILFDELDALVMNRIDNSDLREMGRVTSTFLKEFDSISKDILIIGTTNLKDNFDKALLRRFDATISFDRYTKADLIDIATSILQSYMKKVDNFKADIRLFHKILNNLTEIPYPGELDQIIKVSIAFADESNEYDYLRRIFESLNHNVDLDISKLIELGYTTREIEILTNIPKSTVSRKTKAI